LQNLPVILCLDRAGLVGEDGPTHHGVFDIAYLRCIPNMIIYAPKDTLELRNILYTASLGLDFPIAIRYPRGRGTIINWEQPFEKVAIGTATCLKMGTTKAVLSTGFIGNNVTEALQNIECNAAISHYDFGFIKPLDEALLHDIFKKYNTIFTIEDGTIKGGFGSAVVEFAAAYNYKNIITVLGIPDHFIEQGTVHELQKICKIDSVSLATILN
jgi:1-deoxy-D-xylulose-5-phosphate synthase